ncbi:acyl-CoA thioesterase [Leucothrix arctica]|uniref:Acyl-CoA thioesterase n=1 Tax=Leucothrix arctica TaxID=1481894 RepID=A0A317CBW0_9GAMM|nr:thioesterase family protein [Leucothrix arctica]PWQ95857.1 acyl-CoA thioesterase [Leucothrix arctica]
MPAESKYLDDYRKMQRSDFSHFFDMPTRWGDSDAFGHINNALYSRYYESARVSYFEKAMDMEFKMDSKEGLILADMKIAFLQQLHYPTEMEIGSRVSRLGNSSLVLDAAIFTKGSDTLVNTSRATLVYFDFKGNDKKVIPESARDLICAFEINPPA